MLTAFYAGSFDPITNGHLDVIRQTLNVAHKIVVAIGVHPGKAPLFDASERLAMIMECCQPIAAEMGRSLEVVSFGDLTVNAARRHGASLLVRGLRDGTDLDYEMQIAGMNFSMAPEVQTVFFPASPTMRPITGTLVRQIASLGGDVSSFVPQSALRKLQEKFNG